MTRVPRRLDVFHRAHRLALDTHRLSAQLPDEERYALQTQMRRAAVSVPSNVVEGCTRQSAREYCRFLEIAQGSASELSDLLTLATMPTTSRAHSIGSERPQGASVND